MVSSSSRLICTQRPNSHTSSYRRAYLCSKLLLKKALLAASAVTVTIFLTLSLSLTEIQIEMIRDPKSYDNVAQLSSNANNYADLPTDISADSGTSSNTEGMAKYLPKCIIIGTRKSGTRALIEFLSLHPMLKTARFETHFFDSNESYAKGLEWYREQMPYSLPDQITIEKTPAYFSAAYVPLRVRQSLNATTRFLLIVREPITRTISDYTQVHFTKLAKNKTHSPLEILALDAENRNAINEEYKPVRNSLYAQHLRRWLNIFPLSRIHIIDGDSFIRDPKPELRKIERFFGLKHEIDSTRIYFNETKGFYCYYSDKGESRCLGDSKGRPHITVSANFIKRLQEFFRPLNEEFFKLANIRFNWNY